MVGSMTEPAVGRAIDPVLFDWPATRPALRGARCRDCGALGFPASASCRRCGSEAVAPEELPRRGRLWTWTVQHLMPKEPYRSSETAATFVPYGVGYVELLEGLCIESRLTESDPGKLCIGAEMELVIHPQWVEPDGTAVMSFAFKPV